MPFIFLSAISMFSACGEESCRQWCNKCNPYSEEASLGVLDLFFESQSEKWFRDCMDSCEDDEKRSYSSCEDLPINAEQL